MICSFLLSVCVINGAYSQEDGTNMRLGSSEGQAQDSIAAAMYQQYLELQKAYAELQDSILSLKSGFTDVTTRVSGLNSDLSSSIIQINKLTQNDLLSKESRIKVRKAKIVGTSRFLRASLNSFDAIDAALAQSDYLNDVATLNNPTNTDLGFSLSEDMIKLLEEEIISKNPKFNNKNPNKFKQMVTAIVENPVVTAITSSVPALASINAVVDLVSTVVSTDRYSSVDHFESFRRQLKKYISHYEALARASYDFNSNIDNLKVKTDALRVVLTTFTNERIGALSPDAIQEGDPLPLNNILSLHFRPELVETRIDGIISSYRDGRGRISYQEVLDEPKLDYPLYAINQIQFIQQELKRINNQYISNYQLYHQRLMETLEKSKSLSHAPEKVDKKRKDLDEKLTRLTETFRRSVNIQEVTLYLQEIPAY